MTMRVAAIGIALDLAALALVALLRPAEPALADYNLPVSGKSHSAGVRRARRRSAKDMLRQPSIRSMPS